jgi:LacI family transcriptional regulator/LacI family repressor for deo operon, udp, cdd, tsx, nupC, and nupG
MPAARRISIKDIARAAGVSSSTVSRALNDSSLISLDVRARIQRLAREMGYTPNALAQSLQSNRSHSVGVIITTISDPYFARLVQGVEEAARQKGLTVFLATSSNDPDNEIRILENFQRRRVDGVILAASRIGEEYARQFEHVRLPVIMVNNQATGQNPDLHSLSMDDLSGGEMAAEHLYALGHRRIGYAGMRNRPGSNARRLQGYQAVMRRHGLEARPELICHSPEDVPDGLEGDFTAGKEMALALLDQGASAIFCYCDSVAAGALAACRERNFSVPEQVSIIGYDDSDLCPILTPALTTIHQPALDMGRMALQMLAKTLSGEPVADTVLQPSLVMRGSTAPAGQS